MALFILGKRGVIRMTEVPIRLNMPDNIYKGMMDGSLTICGVAKDSNNIIRKHIPTVNMTKKEKIFQIMKKNKNLIIIGGIGSGSLYVYNRWKKQKIREVQKDINESINEYLKASRDGKLNIKVIEKLLTALDKLDEKKSGRDIELTISVSQFTELIFSIFTYTEALAKVNDYDVKVDRPKLGMEGNIVSLKSYLEIQKNILEKTA